MLHFTNPILGYLPFSPPTFHAKRIIELSNEKKILVTNLLTIVYNFDRVKDLKTPQYSILMF